MHFLAIAPPPFCLFPCCSKEWWVLWLWLWLCCMLQIPLPLNKRLQKSARSMHASRYYIHWPSLFFFIYSYIFVLPLDQMGAWGWSSHKSQISIYRRGINLSSDTAHFAFYVLPLSACSFLRMWICWNLLSLSHYSLLTNTPTPPPTSLYIHPHSYGFCFFLPLCPTNSEPSVTHFI